VFYLKFKIEIKKPVHNNTLKYIMTFHYYNNRKRLTEEKIKHFVKKTFKINKILPKDLLTLIMAYTINFSIDDCEDYPFY
tara:strand:- start:66 stop:305 length:240 start_codon:yes stop_codon:yes gene_type:complete